MKVIDAHTHLSGSESEESAEGIVACLDVCEVENAFVFAPLLNVHTWELTDKHLDDIRAHNNYCADLCSRAPERLYGFCVLNPVPRLAGGSFKRAVELMIEEVRRCYHELGLLGVEPKQWQLRADLSFGPPDDWQLSSWQRAVDSLSPEMLCYGSDLFWPVTPDQYLEEYLHPQRGLFEVALTNGHIAKEGSSGRKELREKIFYKNVLEHWQSAVHEPQQPKRARRSIATPRARTGHGYQGGRRG